MSKENNLESNNNTLRFELKEVVTYVSLLLTLLFGYFGVVKDLETRLVKLETRLEYVHKLAASQSNNSELHADPGQ